MYVKHRELKAILIVVMTTEYVPANQILKVQSVILVLPVSTTFQIAQVGGTNLFA